jgi:transposase-like protein
MKKEEGDGSKPDRLTEEPIKVESVQKEQMVGHGSKFGRRKEAVIAALLSCRTLEEAARTAGIGATTLLRWMKNPEFQAEYRAALNTAVSQANARIQQSSGAAAATIVKIMLSADTKDSIRLRAADMVLSHSKDAQIEDVVARVRDLERAKSDKDNPND